MKRAELRPEAVALWSLLFYLDPARRFWPFLAACAVHETAHLLVLYLLGGRVRSLSLGILGAQIDTELPRWALLAATLAGPASNLLLAPLFACSAPRFALVNLLLGVYNLLPVPPLDGAQILALLFPRSQFPVALIVLALLGLLSLMLTYRGLGLWPIIVYALLLVRAGLEMAVAKWSKTR